MQLMQAVMGEHLAGGNYGNIKELTTIYGEAVRYIRRQQTEKTQE